MRVFKAFVYGFLTAGIPLGWGLYTECKAHISLCNRLHKKGLVRALNGDNLTQTFNIAGDTDPEAILQRLKDCMVDINLNGLADSAEIHLDFSTIDDEDDDNDEDA